MSAMEAASARRLRLASTCAAVLCCLLARSACAELLDLQVQRDGGKFEVSFELRVRASPDELRSLIRQPELWPGFSKLIVSADLLETRPQGQLVSMLFRDCLLWWCSEVRKTSEYRVTPQGDVVAVGVPGRGDFISARERWHIAPEGEGSRLEVSAELVPGFRVPPFIGPALARSSLRRLLNDLERGVEAAARRAAR
jgi:hypothetical protein